MVSEYRDKAKNHAIVIDGYDDILVPHNIVIEILEDVEKDINTEYKILFEKVNGILDNIFQEAPCNIFDEHK